MFPQYWLLLLCREKKNPKNSLSGILPGNNIMQYMFIECLLCTRHYALHWIVLVKNIWLRYVLCTMECKDLKCSFISFDKCMHLHIPCLYQYIKHFCHPGKFSSPVNPHLISNTTAHLISFAIESVILPVLIFLGNGIILFCVLFFHSVYFFWDYLASFISSFFLLLHIIPLCE